MKCPKCNEDILAGNTCLKCGLEINNSKVENYNNVYNENKMQNFNTMSNNNINDETSTLAGFLSFFLPQVGIILYFLNRRTKPNFANGLKPWIIARLVLMLIGFILLLGYFLLIFGILGILLLNFRM